MKFILAVIEELFDKWLTSQSDFTQFELTVYFAVIKTRWEVPECNNELSPRQMILLRKKWSRFNEKNMNDSNEDLNVLECNQWLIQVTLMFVTDYYYYYLLNGHRWALKEYSGTNYRVSPVFSDVNGMCSVSFRIKWVLFSSRGSTLLWLLIWFLKPKYMLFCIMNLVRSRI